MGLFIKAKTCIIAKFHGIDLVIWDHSREGEPPSYGQINTVELSWLLNSIEFIYTTFTYILKTILSFDLQV